MSKSNADFERAITYCENQGGAIRSLWAIPIRSFLNAFGFGEPDHTCMACGEKQTPHMPFWYASAEDGTVVGYICDHLDCGAANQTSLLFSEESELHGAVVDIFDALDEEST